MPDSLLFSKRPDGLQHLGSGDLGERAFVQGEILVPLIQGCVRLHAT